MQADFGPLAGTVALSLISGLAGALLTTVVFARRENRRYRVETLKRFAANRYDLRGDEFSRALNEIFVAFNDDSAVMTALASFHQAVTTRTGDQATEDRLVGLYKAMCAASGISLHDFNDSFFLKPFNTRAATLPSSVAGVQARGAI